MRAPLFARTQALLAGDSPVAVGVEALEAGQRPGLGLGEADAAVAIGVGNLKATLSDSGEAAPLTAPLHPKGAALGTKAAAVGTIAALGSAGVELGPADHAVTIGIEACEEAGAPLLAIAKPFRPTFAPLGASRCGTRLRLRLRDEAVAVGVGAGELRLDARLERLAGEAGSVAPRPLREQRCCDKGGRRARKDHNFHHVLLKHEGQRPN